MKNITLTDIDVFAENYNIPENKELEKLITKQGINKALLDKKIIAENPFEFNVELPSYHHYDQLKSGRCWCFSSVNMIEGNIIENMNINPEELSLSINYFTFFDKLEKTNFIYNYIIENKTDIEYLNQTIINDNYGNLIEGSYYTDFANIVNKYGIVPSKAMEETIDTNNSEKFIILWREKVKRDCLDILEKKSKLSIIKLYELKKQKLNDMYCFLS
ncbi:MAG: hypothetical protein IJ093_00520, partial [Bacilli bacterium]|nr:hypothetical protein [Bacilli bacterium]